MPAESVPKSIPYATPFGDLLEPNETLIWTGQPLHGLALRLADSFRIILGFSLFAGGFEWTWHMVVLTAWGRLSGQLYALALMSPGAVMLVVGGLILAGRLVLDPWQRRRTWYGVTDRRAIVVTDWFTREVHARDLRPLDMIDVRRHRDGTGTITFDCPVGAIRRERLFGRGEASRYAFDRTADVEAALAAISAVRKSADDRRQSQGFV